MRKYELMYIIRPNIEEDAKKAVVERFEEILTSNGAEIVEATKKVAQEVLSGNLKVNQIDEDLVSSYLLTAQLNEYQDVDFLIRSSGEERISNFLLWQNAYSEFYFTDILWPDFDADIFKEAISEYQARNRRYGGV